MVLTGERGGNQPRCYYCHQASNDQEANKGLPQLESAHQLHLPHLEERHNERENMARNCQPVKPLPRIATGQGCRTTTMIAMVLARIWAMEPNNAT